MKKGLLFTAFAVITFTMNAQATFGATAGYISATSKIDNLQGQSFSSSIAGFFAGITLEIEAGNRFYIQPELHYTNIDNLNFLRVPIFAKYYVSDNEKFYLQGGPSITYTLEEISDDFTKFNIGLGLGLGYNFTEQLYVDSKAALQINNYYTGIDNFKSRLNFVTIALGYNLN